MSTLLTAVLLAGGRSRRMGRDKAWIDYHGVPLICRQLETLRRLHPAGIMVSARSRADFDGLGVSILPDTLANRGPLGGIESALAAAPTPLILVLAVDMPRITTSLLRRLVDACTPDCGVVPRCAGCLEPLAAVYPARAVNLARDLLVHRIHTASTFAQFCADAQMVQVKTFPQRLRPRFVNWNTPADIGSA